MVERRHLLLCLKILVEQVDLVPHLSNVVYLCQQNLIQSQRVVLYVGARLIDTVQQRHFIFDHSDGFIDVLAVVADNCFLFFEDLLDDLLVVLIQQVGPLPVFAQQVFAGWHVRPDYLLLAKQRLNG